jgi:hypothetical protein
MRFCLVAAAQVVLFASALICQRVQGSQERAADTTSVQNPLEIWSSKDETAVFSHTGVTYRAIVDTVHGGVLAGLHVPGDGPNLVYNQHAPFRGFMNVFCMMLGKDANTGKEKAVGRSTAWWLKNSAPVV